MAKMWQFMLMTSILIAILSYTTVNSDLIASSSSHDDLLEMLHTEKVLIDSLRHYIETQEQSLNILKSNIQKVQNIHDSVGTNREKYVSNPINAVTILKRFTSDWRDWKKDAEQYLNTEELINNIKKQQRTLTFPTEDDYDEALGNLLRIQDMFKLDSQRLSVGEVSGLKLGSEMSWSDCLEIGIKSLKKGYPTYAKYWMETALEKIPNVLSTNNATTTNAGQSKESDKSETTSRRDEYNDKARLEVLKALLNLEYKAGNLDRALTITTEMLEINPKQKNVFKAIEQIKDAKKKNRHNNSRTKKDKSQQQKMTIKKTDEELMIEEICRDATNSQQIHSVSMVPHAYSSHQPQCILQTHNLKWLLLQPLQVELLSLDPFIVIYHNVLSDIQLSELKEFVVENDNSDDEDSMQFTKIGLKKMRQINEKLHYVTGHERDALDTNHWQVSRYNFENLMKLETTSPKAIKTGKSGAGLLFNMQQSLLGGSVIFPQLELSINLPKGALLYWSTLNEFNEEDYRANYHVCPVIGGTQLTATTYV